MALGGSRFLWKLYAGYAVVILVSVATVGILVARQIASDSPEEIRVELRSKALLLRDLALPALLDPAAEEIRETVHRLGVEMPERLTVVLADGKVIADSDHDPATMDDHGTRDEILRARADGFGSAVRFSDTVKTMMMYVALSVHDKGRLIGYVRVAMPLTVIDQRLAAVRGKVGLGAGVAALLGLLVGLVFARRVTRPLSSMIAAAERLSSGDPDARVEAVSHDEVGKLARAFNRMADVVRDRMETITEDRNKVIAIFRSMVEGVVAVDGDERVVQMNSVATELLRAQAGDVVGKRIWEVTRMQEVCELLREAVSAGRDVTAEVRTPDGPVDQCIDMRASPVRDGSGVTVGAVVLLHDLTEQRRLETMRTDFVANVSHELKTPLTAIRGLLETLIDDADMVSEIRNRFLGKAANQTMRLTALVADLMSLSRVESEDDEAKKEHFDLSDPVAESVHSNASKAEEKGIAFESDLADGEFLVHGDSEAVRQVADNLIVNAIKYTPEGGHVWVRLFGEQETGVLEVQDTGIGIEPKHHDRLFERFYRVDPARSRELGGTGLGLSIVKHIVLNHGGDVSLESEPGKGSTFRVTIPLTEG